MSSSARDGGRSRSRARARWRRGTWWAPGRTIPTSGEKMGPSFRWTTMDLAGAEDWIRSHLEPTGAIEPVHERPWATVFRVPVNDGVAWFKACAPVQAFEPRLTARLFARWPDRVAEVIAH